MENIIPLNNRKIGKEFVFKNYMLQIKGSRFTRLIKSNDICTSIL